MYSPVSLQTTHHLTAADVCRQTEDLPPPSPILSPGPQRKSFQTIFNNGLDLSERGGSMHGLLMQGSLKLRSSLQQTLRGGSHSPQSSRDDLAGCALAPCLLHG